MEIWNTLQGLWRPAIGAQALVLLFCVALAWALPWWLLRRQYDAAQATAAATTEPPLPSITLGRYGLDGALFPLLLLGLAYVAQVVLTKLGLGGGLFTLALPILGALAAIRIGVKVLHAAYPSAPLVRLIEQTFSWVVWVGVLLWLTGVLPALMTELEQITWKVGGTKLSLRAVVEGVLTGGAVLILALWVSSAIESRLLRSATGSELSLRKVVANTTRALLMFVGLLLALSAVGIDLTALSVRSGWVSVLACRSWPPTMSVAT
jgi:small-conductance mechanosensitive channel